MFKEKIQPSLVLTLICLITCALLVIAYNATYVDNTGVITEAMTAGLEEIYGTSDGFAMKLDENDKIYAPEGVTCVLVDENGNAAFEITTDGYSSGGIHVLVGMDASGAVSGVSVLSLGETPGLGTNTNKPEFLNLFKGMTGPVTIVKNKSNPGENEVNAVTSATFSSKGVASAVNIALDAYKKCGGEFK